MLRDDLLKSKRDELSNCSKSRKRKLQELYFATVSKVSQHTQYDARVQNSKGEAAFLEANNILEGRFFDPSTLPFVTEPDLTYGTRPSLESNPTYWVSTTTIRHGQTHTSNDDKEQSISEAGTAKELGDAPAERTQGGLGSLYRPQKGFGRPPSSPKSASKAIQASLHSADAVTFAMRDRVDRFIPSKVPIYNKLEQDLPPSFETFKPIRSDQDLRTGTVTPAPTLLHDNDLGIPPSPNHTGSRSTEADLDTTPNQHTQQELQDNPTKRLYDSSIDNTPNSADSGALRTAQSSLGSPLATTAQDDKSSDHDDRSRVLSLDRDRKFNDELLGVSGTAGDLTNALYDQLTENDARPLHADASTSDSNGVERSIGTPSTPDAHLRLEEIQRLSMAPGQIKDQRVSVIQPPHDTDVGKGTVRSEILQDTAINVQASDDPISKDNKDHSERGHEHYGDSERHTSTLQERRPLGMTRNMPNDLTLSQRPPMRIDTEQALQKTSSVEVPIQEQAELQTPCTSATPAKLVENTSNPTPPERMTTRVSSGALRHKSVSEILGETPKQSGDKSVNDRVSNERKDDLGEQSPSYGPLMSSPDSINFRSRLSELREREKERTKLSTVVFLRQQPSDLVRKAEGASGNYTDSQDTPDEPKDYLLSLFALNAPSQTPNLSALLSSAHKTLTTSSHYADFHQQQDCSILNKIHTLQSVKKWPLRQPQRSIEPDRPASQWDAVLGHVKWMRTDFREERKWKIAAANNLADWCAEWVASSADRRISLQVSLLKQPHISQSSREPQMNKVSMTELAVDKFADDLIPESTPELIASAEDDLSDAMEEDFSQADITRVVAPAAIFSLAPEDILFRLDRTPMADKLLSELPLYQPWKNAQGGGVEFSSFIPDTCWKTSIVPISKYATGKMISQNVEPPRKKSRYDYMDDGGNESFLTGPAFLSDDIIRSATPEQDYVALFNPDNKHIRDRIHAGHAFRPPSEYNMPSQNFFECRQPSQWTWTEDDELRRLVREYAYNWSLISSCLSSPSLFSSGAERRTPWECFERWVALDGLPADMSKTQYFRTYFLRLEAAQRNLMAQQQAMLLQQQQHQQQGSSTTQPPIRRRNTQPMRVERRRNVKHLAMVHAIQKQAKKREGAIQKAHHVASLAAMRKANEAAQPRQRMRTPQEFSHYKHERECKMAEKADAYRQSVIAQQRVLPAYRSTVGIQADVPPQAALVQKASQQNGQPQVTTNGAQPGRNSTSGVINGSSPHLASSLPSGPISINHPSQNRPLPPSQVATTGVPPLSSSQVHNGQHGSRSSQIPSAPMQPHMQGQQRVPAQIAPDNMRVFLEASRLQQEQQRYLQQQQQRQIQAQTNGQGGTLSSPPTPSNINSTAQINNAAVLANLQASNGVPSPAISGGTGPPRSSASPRLNNSMQAQPLSSGMIPAVNQISNEIKARHPQFSPEQVSKMTTESLNQYRMMQSRAAMQAAAGNAATTGSINGLQVPPQQPAMGGSNVAPMLDPRIYAQMMRSQQSSQQTRNGASGVNGVRPPSRGAATPQIPRNTNGQVGPNQSPRPPQAQMAGAQ